MIYGTKLLDTEMELFAASLSQTEVLVWLLKDVYEQVDSGYVHKFSPDYVVIRSNRGVSKTIQYRRDQCEFSIRFPGE